MWPETHSKSTAVESCSVKDVWKNTRNTPATAPNVENPSIALLIKGVRFRPQKSFTCTVCHGFHNFIGERDILSLKTRCDNSSNGCNWEKELRSLHAHMAKCGFTLLSCPNKCYKGRTKPKVVQLLRKDLKKHTEEECPRRKYECPHCHEAGEYQERTTTHLEECPMIEVPCPKRRCLVRTARCNLIKHHQECLFVRVPSKYATLGCDEEVLRKDLKEHEGDSQQHLQLVIDTVHQQQITITEQQTTIREQESLLAHLRSKEMPMIYKFTSYEYHKTAGDEIYSPAFYTSPGGYKMCICVIANGNGKGEGTHVSVFAHLMKGENDNHLPWPFTGTVTIELLNQLEDNNHYSIDITFPPDDEANQRVMNDGIPTEAWGCEQYISFIELGYDAAENCQYLKDDCLYFSISVDAMKSPKTWLI